MEQVDSIESLESNESNESCLWIGLIVRRRFEEKKQSSIRKNRE